MVRVITAIALFLLFLTGCGPKEGTVLDKRYKPDMSYWGTQTSCTTVNGRQSCTSSPHWYYNPEEYTLILRTPDGKVKNKDVKRQVYYSINIGDYYREK